MAFLCQHILWVYLTSMIIAICLILCPFLGPYRESSRPLKALIWLSGSLTFAMGALAQILGYNLYHPFLGRGALAVIVPLLRDLKFVSLGLMLLLFCLPEFWKVAASRRSRNHPAAGVTTPDPLAP